MIGDGRWTKVTVSFKDDPEYRRGRARTMLTKHFDIIEWIEQNFGIKAIWYGDIYDLRNPRDDVSIITITDRTQSDVVHYGFRDPQQAMIFKLAWG